MPIVIVVLAGLALVSGLTVFALFQMRSRQSFPNALNHPGRDRGFTNDNLVWTVVGVLAIIALVVFIFGRGR